MEKKTIVVAGAGFGGITALLKLEKLLRRHPEWRLILIDRHAYHLYTPMLYEIASVPREEAPASALKSAIVIPLEDIVAGKNIIFIQGEIAAIRTDQQTLALADGTRAEYAFLVLALGSATNYFDIPGLQEYACPLKTFEDAVRIRNRIEALSQERRALTLIVGGAGSAGVELAAEFSNFLCSLERLRKEKNTCVWRVVLIEADRGILPGHSRYMQMRAAERLRALGIEIKNKSRIKEVSEDRVFFDDGSSQSHDLLIWTGGVTGIPLYQTLGMPLTKKRTPAVNEFLEAEENVFAVGDGAGFLDTHTGTLLSWNVPLAEAQGRLTAHNIIRRIQGKSLIPFRPLRAYPSILAVGKKYAIADLVILRWHGFFGWIAKLLVELRYLCFILPVGKALRRWARGVRVYSSNDR